MLKKIVPLHADLADYRELVEVDALFNAVNRSHGWQEVDSVKKDKDIVYGVEAMFNAGFTVAEKVQVELATAEAEEGEKDSGDKGWWTK